MIGNCEDIREKSGHIYFAITNYVFFPTGAKKNVSFCTWLHNSWMSFDHPLIDNVLCCACHFQS